LKQVLGIIISVVLLGGCVTNTFYTSKELASEKRLIALVSPDIELSVLNAGGVTEPHAEWTELAEKYFSRAISKKFRSLKIQLINNSVTQNMDSEDSQEVQLIRLHEVVGSTILTHQSILPTKRGKFEWTLGKSAVYLKDKYGADYALFVYIRDSYTSPGRAAVILVAAVFGVGIQGGTQIGYASLVNLNSGDIVWFNKLTRASGDLRTAKASEETVSQLLNSFPQ
jgi:hypothetical protein